MVAASPTENDVGELCILDDLLPVEGLEQFDDVGRESQVGQQQL